MGLKAPHPDLTNLPLPKEKFETIAILKQASISAGLLGEMKGIAQTLPNQAMLVNAIVLQEAKDSSEIENIITTQDELYEAMTSEKRDMPAATKEVISYREAIFKGFNLIQKNGILRLKDLLLLQEMIVDNDAGIRSIPGTVLRNDVTGKVVYTPPQEKKEIQDLLANFLEHFNRDDNDTSPLVNLAVLHHQFESIHPFYDGNGRTGRILNILYLIMNQQLDLPILYLSSFIIDHKKDYYRLLNKTNANTDWEEWIIFMLRAVEDTARSTIQKISNIRDLLEETTHFTQENAPKIYRKELIELLFEQPYSKIDFVTQRIGLERKAAARHLKKMTEIGVLESIKVGRETIYINRKLLEVLK
ncbi:MAG: Fic/DOC family N-terminal domain-containing protein [Crocinitomicaceae bacterium]|nr:Fic/DOC family N-terminal domain-containing protein [Crocinitomicaceae bacterium]